MGVKENEKLLEEKSLKSESEGGEEERENFQEEVSNQEEEIENEEDIDNMSEGADDSEQSEEVNSEKMEVEESKNNGKNDSDCEDRTFETGEHVDCLDTTNKWLNAEITAIRSNKVRVHYNGWSTKYDEWIDNSSSRIQKQWIRGAPFCLNNRIDIRDEGNNWLEGRIIEINGPFIRLHYYGYANKFDEWIRKDSERIAEVGSYSNAYGAARYKNNEFQRNNKLKLLIQKEIGFKQQMEIKGFYIKAIEGDGNCLFRAVADQIYGDQNYHKAIRRICLDYIEIEKDFFKNYVIGNFEDYVLRKKNDGVWGDDVEIQAMSEIYNRAFEIYAYSNEPMRTFHESKKMENIDLNQPIRLAYHGKSHYNSIRRIREDESVPKNKFGPQEDKALKLAKNRAIVKKQPAASPDRNNDIEVKEEEIIMVSRQEFENKGKRDMEAVLEESLSEFLQENKKKEDNELELTIKESLDQMDVKQDEEEIIKMVLKETAEDMKNKEKMKEIYYEQDPELTTALEISKKELGCLPTYSTSINKVLQSGFPMDMVLQAYAIVGDDYNQMIEFIMANLY